MANKLKSQNSKVKNVVKLSDLTVAELTARARELRIEIAKSRLNIAAGKEKNVKKVFNLRHDLAKTLTMLKMKLVR